MTDFNLDAVLGFGLSDEQRAVVCAPLSPMLVVAGAGTGKTTAMASRVVWLVGTGQVRPDEVLGLTFTTKAAGELAERVRMWLGRSASATDDGEPVVATYNSFAQLILAEHGLRLGVEPDARLMTDAVRRQLVVDVIRRTRVALDPIRVGLPDLASAVLTLDGALSDRMVSPSAVRDHDAGLVDWLSGVDTPQKIVVEMVESAQARLAVTGLVEEYRAAKAARGLTEFSDQMRQAAELAEAFPVVAETIRATVKVVLLDEYQDTSVAQARLMRALFADGRAVTAVGDPCQAIYGWRGAHVDNIDAFPRDFPDAHGQHAPVVALAENRRSGEAILAAANVVSAPLREQHEGTRALVAPVGRPRGDGLVEVCLTETVDDEIAWVADRIASMDPEARRGPDDQIAWRHVAVLARGNRMAADVHDALRARGIPSHLVGAAALLERPEVVDVVSVLEVLADPTANAALLRLLTGPRWSIGPRDLARLGERARALAGAGSRGQGGDPYHDAVAGVDPTDVVALYDAVEDPGGLESGIGLEARERCADLAAVVRGLRRHLGDPLDDLVHRVVAVTGLDVEVAASPEAYLSGRRDGIDALFDLVATFRDVDGRTSLPAFVSWVHDARRFGDAPTIAAGAQGDAVAVLTAHTAKGLEWPFVVVVGVSSGVFPSGVANSRWPTARDQVPYSLWLSGGRRRDPRLDFPGNEPPRSKDYEEFKRRCAASDLDDERRVAYVALTRAQSTLVVTGHRWGRTQKKPRALSPFLDEVCASGAAAVMGWADEPQADAANPLKEAQSAPVAWPRVGDLDAHGRRIAAADRVRELMADPAGARPTLLDDAEAALVAGWDRDLDVLVAEAHAGAVTEARVVRVPDSLSTSALLTLAADPESFAADLARPMPRRPSAAARRGTRFHAWVEALGVGSSHVPLIPRDDLPGSADDDLVPDADLEGFIRGFAATGYAGREPYAVEAPFALVLGGRVVRGRIDAVFRTVASDGTVAWEVVDWKTGRRAGADPRQLAVYRSAWALAVGVPELEVAATFVYVADSTVTRYLGDDLPGRAELEALFVTTPP